MTDEIETLLQAAKEFIESRGGFVAVIGGIGVAERPPLKLNYTLTIDFTGRKPTSETPKPK